MFITLMLGPGVGHVSQYYISDYYDPHTISGQMHLQLNMEHKQDIDQMKVLSCPEKLTESRVHQMW